MPPAAPPRARMRVLTFPCNHWLSQQALLHAASMPAAAAQCNHACVQAYRPHDGMLRSGTASACTHHRGARSTLRATATALAPSCSRCAERMRQAARCCSSAAPPRSRVMRPLTSTTATRRAPTQTPLRCRAAPWPSRHSPTCGKLAPRSRCRRRHPGQTSIGGDPSPAFRSHARS